MKIKSNIKFSPELLITAPRRSPAVPSPDGSYALYTVSTYSLESHTETKEIKIANLKSDETSLFSDDEKNYSPQWLIGHQVLWLRKGDGGKTELWVGNAGSGNKNAYQTGEFDAAVDGVKIKVLPDGNIALGFSALVNDDGKLFNAEKQPKPLSSAREYETVNVRLWDRYYTKERGTFWYTTLEKAASIDRYKLSEKGLVNALENTGIEFSTDPSEVSSLDHHIDLSEGGILLVSRDPEVDPAKRMSVGLWYLSISSYTSSPQKIQRIRIPGVDGLCFAPSFSRDGKKAVFLSTKTGSLVANFNRIFVLHFFGAVKVLVEVVPIRDEEKREGWDLSPSSALWSNDGSELYVTAEERARVKLWKIPIREPLGHPVKKPLRHPTISTFSVVATAFSGDGSVASVYPLSKAPSEKRILINKTSLVNNGIYYITDPRTGSDSVFHSMAFNELSLGLSRSQISEIGFQGDGEYRVQAWVFKPSDFDEKKRYPLAFLVHGGPNGTWPDSWSTRWNPAVWAGQGYVVVAPNPTGSNSFGQAFAAAVQGEWGGRPYKDLVRCFEYIENEMPFVDTSRAIAAGGSYGGYMMNWIAGQPLASKFKTLISHDGIFSFQSMLSSDIPTALDQFMGSHLWSPDPSSWEKYNPASNTSKWKTPMLFIHSDTDFRCPITEGLAPYHLCKMKGIESRFLNFPDENHFVLKRENSWKWYKTALGWANKYVGNKGEGVMELEPPVTEPRMRGKEGLISEERF